MNTGIYIITNIINNKCYIGSAINIKDRWGRHKKALENKKHHSVLFQRAYDKYGSSCLDFKILLYCTKENLLFYEQLAINTYKPEYNICKIAGSQLGMKRNEETKARMSKAQKGRIISEDTKNKMSNAQKGNTKSLGHKLSTENKLIVSNAHKGLKHTDEAKAKISAAGKGRIVSEETKAKILATKARNREILRATPFKPE